MRHTALSNFTPERMREWFETARRLELTLPVAIRPQYNLVARKDYEQGYAPIAEEFDAAAFPYFALALAWPLAKGVTSARTPEQLPALMAAPTLALTEDEVAALDAVSAVFA